MTFIKLLRLLLHEFKFALKIILIWNAYNTSTDRILIFTYKHNLDYTTFYYVDISRFIKWKSKRLRYRAYMYTCGRLTTNPI